MFAFLPSKALPDLGDAANLIRRKEHVGVWLFMRSKSEEPTPDRVPGLANMVIQGLFTGFHGTIPTIK